MRHIFCLLLCGNLAIAAVTPLSCQTPSGSSVDLHIDVDSPVPSVFESTRNRPGLVLLSASKACGLDVDFAKTCSGNLVKKEMEFNYSFRCDDLYGDFYVNTASGGRAEFRCFGDTVGKEYENREYGPCTTSR